MASNIAEALGHRSPTWIRSAPWTTAAAGAGTHGASSCTPRGTVEQMATMRSPMASVSSWGVWPESAR